MTRKQPKPKSKLKSKSKAFKQEQQEEEEEKQNLLAYEPIGWKTVSSTDTSSGLNLFIWFLVSFGFFAVAGVALGMILYNNTQNQDSIDSLTTHFQSLNSFYNSTLSPLAQSVLASLAVPCKFNAVVFNSKQSFYLS